MKLSAIDLFCGIGGLTKGVENSGINVVVGYDIEESCRYAYETNNKSSFINKDIKEINGVEVKNSYPLETDIRILMGCAPCQPFSSYSFKYKNNENLSRKMDLLDYFGGIVEGVQPEIVSMENVPQLSKEAVFLDFLKMLRKNNYFVSWEVVFAPDYGVPQNRKRLILLASKLGEIKLISPQYTPDNYVTVRDTIEHMPAIESGEVDKDDNLHKSVKLSNKNLRRIKQSMPGGTWEDWDDDLILACHKKTSGKSYPSVYGRMEWDKPAPTITTQFYGFGNGRFGHPEQDRAISYREGALLQTFPKDYKFIDPDKSISFRNLGIQIGNAVPVKLGEAIGKSIQEHVKEISNVSVNQSQTN